MSTAETRLAKLFQYRLSRPYFLTAVPRVHGVKKWECRSGSLNALSLVCAWPGISSGSIVWQVVRVVFTVRLVEQSILGKAFI